MKTVKVYTDGSHIKGTDNVGYGMCFKDPDTLKIYKHSGILDVKFFLDKFKARVSNPTAELAAAVKTLQYFRHVSNHHVIIYSDYEGVQKWISKDWKVNKNYIKYLMEYADRYIKDMKSHNNTFELKWVKGHSGDEMNELADELARSRVVHTDFPEYVNIYKVNSPVLV